MLGLAACDWNPSTGKMGPGWSSGQPARPNHQVLVTARPCFSKNKVDSIRMISGADFWLPAPHTYKKTRAQIDKPCVLWRDVHPDQQSQGNATEHYWETALLHEPGKTHAASQDQVWQGRQLSHRGSGTADLAEGTCAWASNLAISFLCASPQRIWSQVEAE